MTTTQLAPQPAPKPAYDQIDLGAEAALTRTLTPDLVAEYARLTGDLNPVHLDEDFAAKSFFRRRIAHGHLAASLVGAVLGTRLPGPGAIYLSQTLEFKRPVGLDETITARVRVVEKDDRHQKLKLRTWVENQAGQTVLDGFAEVLVR